MLHGLSWPRTSQLLLSWVVCPLVPNCIKEFILMSEGHDLWPSPIYRSSLIVWCSNHDKENDGNLLFSGINSRSMDLLLHNLRNDYWMAVPCTVPLEHQQVNYLQIFYKLSSKYLMLHIDTVQTSKHESFTDCKYEGAMHSTELSTIPP